ncbi:MAG: hypothetical protein WKF84_05840 [Pyrinomonadaceae bacterium]
MRLLRAAVIIGLSSRRRRVTKSAHGWRWLQTLQTEYWVASIDAIKAELEARISDA